MITLTTLTALAWAAAGPTLTPLPLPGGEGGIGFDDIIYARELGKVVVPAGRSGKVDLVDPATHAVEAIGGFTAEKRFEGGHGEGTTSADTGQGLLFASDRSRRVVEVVDPSTRRVVASVPLQGGPDYVRFVAPRSEVWVTEPRLKAIEIFTLQRGQAPRLTRAGAITLPDGPESLVVDVSRGRAYTNAWHDTTYAIDLATRRVVAQWKNGCTGARGLALDEKRGQLFVGCDEGKAVTLDVAHGGARLGEATAGRGVDIIAFAPGLSHLYVPGGDAKTLTILAVGPQGELTPVATASTAEDAHCVAADDRGGVYVCDPKAGRLLVLHDELTARQ